MRQGPPRHPCCAPKLFILPPPRRPHQNTTHNAQQDTRDPPARPPPSSRHLSSGHSLLSGLHHTYTCAAFRVSPPGLRFHVSTGQACFLKAVAQEAGLPTAAPSPRRQPGVTTTCFSPRAACANFAAGARAPALCPLLPFCPPRPAFVPFFLCSPLPNALSIFVLAQRRLHVCGVVPVASQAHQNSSPLAGVVLTIRFLRCPLPQSNHQTPLVAVTMSLRSVSTLQSRKGERSECWRGKGGCWVVALRRRRHTVKEGKRTAPRAYSPGAAKKKRASKGAVVVDPPAAGRRSRVATRVGKRAVLGGVAGGRSNEANLIGLVEQSGVEKVAPAGPAGSRRRPRGRQGAGERPPRAEGGARRPGPFGSGPRLSSRHRVC